MSAMFSIFWKIISNCRLKKHRAPRVQSKVSETCSSDCKQGVKPPETLLPPHTSQHSVHSTPGAEGVSINLANLELKRNKLC